MAFTVEEITEIIAETVAHIEPCCQYPLAVQTTAWANNNVHRFLEVFEGQVEFEADKFREHVIESCQEIAASAKYPTID